MTFLCANDLVVLHICAFAHLRGNFNFNKLTFCMIYCKHWRCKAQFRRVIISCKFWIFISNKLQIKRYTRFQPSSARTKFATFSTYPTKLFRWRAVWVRTWRVGPTLSRFPRCVVVLGEARSARILSKRYYHTCTGRVRESTATRTLTLLNLYCVAEWPQTGAKFPIKRTLLQVLRYQTIYSLCIAPTRLVRWLGSAR